MKKMKTLEGLFNNNEKEETSQGHYEGDSVVASLLDLPDSVLVDITLRLPVENILRCRLVCKQWLCLISELPFTTIYQNKLFSGTALLVVNRNNTFELLNFSGNDDHTRDLVRPTRCAITFDLPKKGQLRVIDSCEGLICLSHTYCYYNDVTLFVANPILRECVALPKPRKVEQQCLSSYAFGFSEQQYKVLSILSDGSGAICALGNDSAWKSVGYLPFPADERYVTVDGAFHWLAADSQFCDYIYSFNISSEDAQQISLPVPLCGVQRWMTLGVLFDHLCVVKSMKYGTSCEIDIWMMKLYGEPWSWTKQYTLQFDGPMDYPARAWKNEEVAVWKTRYGRLRSYSLARDKYTPLQVSDRQRAFDAVMYTPSLISVKEVMMVSTPMIDELNN